MSNGPPHDWQVFDVERGWEVRQTTGSGEDNRWEIRNPAGVVVSLDDEQFDRLRSGDWTPEELR